jgi:glucosylceramidase
MKGPKYQQIDGFGFTLTGGSAVLINKLPLQARKQEVAE